jgi:hypothetical protein
MGGNGVHPAGKKGGVAQSKGEVPGGEESQQDEDTDNGI